MWCNTSFLSFQCWPKIVNALRQFNKFHVGIYLVFIDGMIKFEMNLKKKIHVFELGLHLV
jgi:hypothetical protein